MNAEQLIEEIETYVDNSKTAGMLSGGSMVKLNREELLSMLSELRLALPKEIAESKRVMNTKESILADARARAERIIQDAAAETRAMIDGDEVVAMANMRAEEIVKDAEDQADEIILKAKETARALQTGALEYTQSMMGGLEYMYSSMLEQEKKYFDSVLSKLRAEHRQIVEDKHEIDLQLGYGSKGSRSRQDFEKTEEGASAKSAE
ncbi:MAG: hypothetical protein Q4D60_07035 [Eubacteriales bacterium]|nr:hypothetical protein [Eubacteriales bacterium]